jgi:cation diffusion facilitator family transporter
VLPRDVELALPKVYPQDDDKGPYKKAPVDDVAPVDDDDDDDTLGNDEDAPQESGSIKAAVNLSWFVNIFLFGAKIVCVYLSGSKSVWASLADSGVDLISQFVLGAAEKYAHKWNKDYPLGRSRYEALGVLACSAIMIAASTEVVQFSALDLYHGMVYKEYPELEVGTAMYVILAMGIGMKGLLWAYCLWANKVAENDTLAALAEDHLNDVFSNIGAIAGAAIAFNVEGAWWVDGMGAIIISTVIIYRWIDIMKEQAQKITGYTAPPEFLSDVSP